MIDANSDLGTYLIDALGGLEWLSPNGLICEETQLECKQIGGFEIEREIGRGGMGIVYAAPSRRQSRSRDKGASKALNMFE